MQRLSEFVDSRIIGSSGAVFNGIVSLRLNRFLFGFVLIARRSSNAGRAGFGRISGTGRDARARSSFEKLGKTMQRFTNTCAPSGRTRDLMSNGSGSPNFAISCSLDLTPSSSLRSNRSSTSCLFATSGRCMRSARPASTSCSVSIQMRTSASSRDPHKIGKRPSTACDRAGA